MHLPGEGLFFLSDPTFNRRGDLLATLTCNGTLAAAAANDSTGLEPDLSVVAHLPARQQQYVIDDSVPTVFHTVALEDLQSDLSEVDELEAETQHRVDQEAIRTGEAAKANQEVAS
ncbi:hypothetical protein CDV31_011016 [Fusarium ambrosium]|uniref:Uncharacterized protein n=1 Tax=Fusarium ambrosium TaxID=131363 RepID=A0A428TJI2_9HYPO|nr:hypothetical protein CDV31_011016 [Fusarium ambrosium]